MGQRCRAASAAVAVACGLASACAPVSGERALPDVVLLVVDGLRADLQQQAAEVVRGSGSGELLVYSRAYAPSSLPEQSLAGLFTGRLPTHGGSVGLSEAQPSEQATTLAASLRAAGYRTGMVSQASWASRPGYTRGFVDLQTAPSAGWSDRETAGRAASILGDWNRLEGEDGRRSPWFLVVHWASPELAEADMPEPERLQAAYAAAMEERLTAIQGLVAELESGGALQNAALALTSGSGFELLEHGDVGSGWTLHEEVVRVPLLLRLIGPPAEAKGPGSGASPEPVSTVRLAATLHALAGVDTAAFPQSPLGETAEADRAVITELVVPERAILRAAVVAGAQPGSEPRLLKYVQILHEAPLADRAALEAGYEELRDAMLRGAVPKPELFGSPKRELVFLLSADPTSLSEEEASSLDGGAELPPLRGALESYQARCQREGWPPPELTEELIIDVDDAAQLEALGYM